MIKHVLWAVTIAVLIVVSMSFTMDLIRPDTAQSESWGEVAGFGIIGWIIVVLIALYWDNDEW